MKTRTSDGWSAPSPEPLPNMKGSGERLAREFFEKWNENLRGEELYASLRKGAEQPPSKGLIETTWIPQELLSG